LTKIIISVENLILAGLRIRVQFSGMAKEDDFTWDDDLMTKSLQRQSSHLAKLGKKNVVFRNF
jgi:hypothetical protein